MKYNLILPFLFLVQCVHNTQYEVVVTWSISFINNRNNEININIHKFTGEDSWSNPVWLNSKNSNQFSIAPDSKETIDLILSSRYVDEEPIVIRNSDYLFHILIATSGVDTDSIDINLFPFPEFKSHVLCSEYYPVNSDTSLISYRCSSDFFDTLTIYEDSIISSTNYFKLFKID